MPTVVRRGPLIAILVIGLGLAAAPAAFQMFSRAPEGGDMINEFRPYMTEDQVTLFQGYMSQIRDADTESREVLEAAIVDTGTLSQADYDAFTLLGALNDQWPAIDADMTDLLDTMERNIDNFEAVDALPPFALFPWFFLLPGLIIASVAALALRIRWFFLLPGLIITAVVAVALRIGRNRSPARHTRALMGLGIAVVLAPVFFQMFTRAPMGGDMINDFRPMMVRERVQGVQGYFITMGGAEGQLRNVVVPLGIDEAGLDAADLPAIASFSADWSSIVGDLAPMVATMSDNVDNFESVDAMPPFPLFPWFFVIPGVLVAGLAWVAKPARPSVETQ